MTQCPYNDACHCAMDENCPGCEEHARYKRRKLDQLTAGEKVWVQEGPMANREMRDRMEPYLVKEVTERNVILESGRRFSTATGEERGKSANLWLVVPENRWKTILLEVERKRRIRIKQYGEPR